MKITFIIGLPGSGKTHFAATLDNEDTVIFDDFSADDIPYLPKEHIKNLIIIDPNLCNPDVLTRAVSFFSTRYPSADIKYIYFENAPAKALQNIQIRGDNRSVANFIKLNTKIYNPPIDALSIWQPE